MRLARKVPSPAATVAALGALLAPALAWGQAAGGSDAIAGSEQRAPNGRPLRVWVEARDTSVDGARLQESLARELRREVVVVSDAGSADVQVRAQESRAEVRYATPSGQQLTRHVELPPDRERALLVVSWLTVNLVRDEASELLGELRARRKAEAEAAEAAARAEAAAGAKAVADRAAAERAAAERAEAAAERERAEAESQRPPSDDGLLRDGLRSFDLAFVTPLSLVPDSRLRELHGQLALVYGDVGAVRGTAVSAAVLRVRRHVEGLALAPAFVLVGGPLRGVVLTAGVAVLPEKNRGVLLAAGVNLSGDLSGVVMAGGVNAARDVQGVMAAGGVNAARDVQGVAMAGGVNAARDLRGAAVAPINVQRRVRGLQLGVVNVAEEVDGVAFGVVSLAGNGRLQPVLWGSSDRTAHVALKSIAGYAFTQLGGGIALNGDELSYDSGAGAHLPLGQGVFLEPGVHYSGTHDTADASGAPDRHDLYYLVQAGLRLGGKLDLLAGGGVRHTLWGGSGMAPEVRAGIGFF